MRVTNKTISIETAKLLGVPFTWGSQNVACKFVHTDEGPGLMSKGITALGQEQVGCTWQKAGIVLRDEVRVFERGRSRLDIYLVVEEDLDAGDR